MRIDSLATQEEPDSACPGRLLGIDYGRKYIGLALSDPNRTIASPLKILRVKNPSEALHQIVDLARKEEVTALVVGLPLDMEGDEGPMAKEIKAWAKRLQLLCGILIYFVDESLSSIEALETAKRLGRHRERYDHLAASLILQAFLHGQS